MRARYPWIAALFSACLAVAATVAVGSGRNFVDGFFYDLSLALNRHRPGAGGEPVAVIALDRESLDSEELADIPRAFLGPVWARLIDGLVAQDARALGFDIIFSYAANRFPELGAQYDRGFLQSLAAHRDRVVLARSARSGLARPIEAALFDPAADTGSEPGAIAYAELFADPDGVQREARASIVGAGREVLPSFAAALVARAGGGPMPQRVLLAPTAALETIPTYRLIDVLRCLDHDPAALRAAFSGKVVLIGGTLAEEDRKRTPDRFMGGAPSQPTAADGCRLGRLGASDPDGRTTPGLFVHAAAVQSVLTGNLMRSLPWAPRLLTVIVTSLAGSVLGFVLRPWLALAAAVVVALACFGGALILLPFGYAFPVLAPAGAVLVSMVLAYIARFLVEERRRRRVQAAFGHYLAPSVVDRLAESEADLRLGGELRDVTIMFADLSGFTALSGKVGPEELMRITNRYLGLIVEAVEATGGYVDKFIGDAVMAVWGAPAPDPDHAASGVRGALLALAKVMHAKAEADALGEHGYAVKMGLNTGPAVIGNVGAQQRYNYTAVGETVNVAARLESVPGDYGCRIVVGPATAAAIADRFVLCELDWIKVKGKADAISVYEVIAEKPGANAAELAYPAQYQSALAHYRAGEFAAARQLWRDLARHPHGGAVTTSPSLVMAQRCAALGDEPPAIWDGVFVKTSK